MNYNNEKVDKNYEGKFRILRKEYKKLTRRFTTVSVLRYAFVLLFVVSSLFLVNFVLVNNELRKDNMYLHEQNLEMAKQIDMYMDTALYFADMSLAMDDTNANLKAVISEQEEELMAYREREELYDKYNDALYNKYGNRTDITYGQIQSLQEYCDEKGYSSEMVDLVLAIAMSESEGRSDAYNKESGATGYGQLLGSTAKFVYTKLEGHEAYYHDVSLDGEANLKMVADYISYLYSYHHNSLPAAIDSYRGLHSTGYINKINSYLKDNDLSIYNIEIMKVDTLDEEE